MRPRVLHVITGLHGGGAEALLYSVLSARTAIAGQEQQVIALLDGGPYVDRIRRLGIAVHTLGMRRSRPSFTALRRYHGLLSEFRPEIVQSWMYHANLLATLARPRDARLIWCLHAPNLDMSPYHPLSRAVRSAGAWLSRRPDVIVVNSEITRRDHVALGYRPRRWALIPNGFDLSRFKPDPQARLEVRRELGLSKSAVLIGLIGRYDAQKDLATFLQAVLAFQRFGMDATFVLAGEGLDPANEALVREIDRLGLNCVRLLGFRADIPRITAALDIATSTSIAESFSNAIAEAMACEVPCVVTNAANLPHLVGDAGVVVPVRDPTAVAEGWHRILRLDAAERNRLGRRGRDRIRVDFSLEAAVQRYEDLYGEVRNRRARGL